MFVSWGKTNDTISNKRHYFLFSTQTKHYLNTLNVETTLGDKQIMSAPNTFGYQVGVGYEYENNKHITYTVTVNYGIHNHTVKWEYSMLDFAPHLNSDTTFSKVEKYKTSYLSTTFSLGYNYHLKKHENILIQVKAGVGLLGFFNSIRENTIDYVGIRNETGDTIHIKNLSYHYQRMGSATYDGGLLPDDPMDSGNNPTAHIYIGGSYKFNNKAVKRLDIGFSYSGVFPFLKWDAGFIRSTYYDFNADRDGVQFYNNRMRSVNLVIGLGF